MFHINMKKKDLIRDECRFRFKNKTLVFSRRIKTEVREPGIHDLVIA